MSVGRFGRNWADVDEDDEEDVVDASSKKGPRCFETPVDEHGIKTVIEYKERDGKTYKVTKRVKQTKVTKWTNPDMTRRKDMEKFGKPKTSDAAVEAMHIVQSEDQVSIELCRKVIQVSQANDAEDKFYEEALKNCENLFKEKKVWTDMNREKQVDRDTDVPAAAKPADAVAPAADAAKAPDAPAGGPARYVPPSVRAAQTGGKGGGKGGLDAQQEASLRITNLSEDVKEGDLQELFCQFGTLQRVYLAKDMNTHLSKGFAFVTYYKRDDAQKAINKLNGHGYDNLILQVQWAKPRA